MDTWIPGHARIAKVLRSSLLTDGLKVFPLSRCFEPVGSDQPVVLVESAFQRVEDSGSAPCVVVSRVSEREGIEQKPSFGSSALGERALAALKDLLSTLNSPDCGPPRGWHHRYVDGGVRSANRWSGNDLLTVVTFDPQLRSFRNEDLIRQKSGCSIMRPATDASGVFKSNGQSRVRQDVRPGHPI